MFAVWRSVRTDEHTLARDADPIYRLHVLRSVVSFGNLLFVCVRAVPCRAVCHAATIILQISKALLNDDSRLRLPRFLEDDTPKDPEATKQDLIDKIAQLNASIDEVAAQLKSKDAPEAEAAEAAASLS